MQYRSEKSSGELRYATSFEVELLGSKCDLEIVVELASQAVSTTISMRQLLSSYPAFKATREELVVLSACIQKTREYADLLDETSESAQTHQLNCTCGGATFIVVKPSGKTARYTLNIGLFNREGFLNEFSSEEIDDAVKEIDVFVARVPPALLTFLSCSSHPGR